MLNAYTPAAEQMYFYEAPNAHVVAWERHRTIERYQEVASFIIERRRRGD